MATVMETQNGTIYVSELFLPRGQAELRTTVALQLSTSAQLLLLPKSREPCSYSAKAQP